MGKGAGGHPPQKFIHDQCFCQILIFLFMGICITLSSLSAGMDDGGSSPYPYFFTGFVLAPILLVNLISRIYVVHAVQNKGLTRKNIVEILNKTTFGKYIWPWSCKVGMFWCIPGSILTGIAGVNCNIEEKENGTMTIRNTCYYDIEGPQGVMYRIFAIGLLVVHMLSFIYLLLSNCPVHGVLDQIKEDPRRNRANTANNRPATAEAANNTPVAAPATNNTPVAAPATNNTPVAAPATNNTPVAAANNASNEMEMKSMVQQLETRVRELENRERQIAVILPPPAYSELMDSTSKSAGAFPGGSGP